MAKLRERLGWSNDTVQSILDPNLATAINIYGVRVGWMPYLIVEFADEFIPLSRKMPVFRNSLDAGTSNAVCIHSVPEKGFDHPCRERANEPYATVNSAAYLLG